MIDANNFNEHNYNLLFEDYDAWFSFFLKSSQL